MGVFLLLLTVVSNLWNSETQGLGVSAVLLELGYAALLEIMHLLASHPSVEATDMMWLKL